MAGEKKLVLCKRAITARLSKHRGCAVVGLRFWPSSIGYGRVALRVATYCRSDS
jgi:hypothetical protein